MMTYFDDLDDVKKDPKITYDTQSGYSKLGALPLLRGHIEYYDRLIENGKY